MGINGHLVHKRFIVIRKQTGSMSLLWMWQFIMAVTGIGVAQLLFSNVYLTTEGGFTYTPFDRWYDVPTSPESPYSGTTYRQSNMLAFNTPKLPPSFTA